MKKLITLLFLLACLSSFGQVVTTKIVKVANSTTIFNENLVKSIEILNIADSRIYLTLKSIPSNKSISTCILNTDIKELGGATTSDTLFTTIAISDETTKLTIESAIVTFRMPIACTLVKVSASVTTAPTGSTLIFDINKNGTSILSTKLSIDEDEKTSKTAIPAVISDSAILNDSEMTIDIDQVGGAVAGAGAKIIIYYIKN